MSSFLIVSSDYADSNDLCELLKNYAGDNSIVAIDDVGQSYDGIVATSSMCVGGNVEHCPIKLAHLLREKAGKILPIIFFDTVRGNAIETDLIERIIQFGQLRNLSKVLSMATDMG